MENNTQPVTAQELSNVAMHHARASLQKKP